jgi:uncharacterized protein YkwD
MRFVVLLAVASGLTACGDDDDVSRSRRRSTTSQSTWPDTAYCAPVETWDAVWAANERDVLGLVNQARAAGGSCGGVAQPPVGPVEWDERLRCAGRVHASDMAERDYFAHNSPEGQEPADRIELAGYEWSRLGENIAFGYRTPMEVVDGWLDSPGHCTNIMNGAYVHMGVGYVADGPFWVQDFGTP